MRSFVLILTVVLSCLNICAGQFIVSGTVYGHADEFIQGVSIGLFRKSQRVNTYVSDSKGHFSIEGLEKSDSMVFSCIGYSSGIYIIKSSADIEIQLTRLTYVPSNAEYLHWVTLKTDSRISYNLVKEKKNDRTSAQLVRFDPDRIFMKVELGPALKGNLGSLDSLINLSIGDIKGKKNSVLTIGFIIDKNGGVGETAIVKSGGKDLDEKVTSFIKQNVKWVPAIQNGIRFSVYCELSFQLMQRINIRILSLSFNNMNYFS
jgi:hypothetical protein